MTFESDAPSHDLISSCPSFTANQTPLPPPILSPTPFPFCCQSLSGEEGSLFLMLSSSNPKTLQSISLVWYAACSAVGHSSEAEPKNNSWESIRLQRESGGNPTLVSVKDKSDFPSLVGGGTFLRRSGELNQLAGSSMTCLSCSRWLEFDSVFMNLINELLPTHTLHAH